MARYGKAAGKSVKSAMHREKRGTLRSGKGGKGGRVTSRSKRLRLDFPRRASGAPKFRGRRHSAIFGRICKSSLAIKAASFAALVADDPTCRSKHTDHGGNLPGNSIRHCFHRSASGRLALTAWRKKWRGHSPCGACPRRRVVNNASTT